MQGGGREHLLVGFASSRTVLGDVVIVKALRAPTAAERSVAHGVTRRGHVQGRCRESRSIASESERDREGGRERAALVCATHQRPQVLLAAAVGERVAPGTLLGAHQLLGTLRVVRLRTHPTPPPRSLTTPLSLSELSRGLGWCELASVLPALCTVRGAGKAPRHSPQAARVTGCRRRPRCYRVSRFALELKEQSSCVLPRCRYVPSPPRRSCGAAFPAKTVLASLSSSPSVALPAANLVDSIA
jgi:hypothetical protein